MSRPVHKSDVAPYTWSGTCLSWVLAETSGLSVKQEHMPPGAAEVWHCHMRADQFFFILKGTATLYLEDEILEVGEQQGLLVNCKTRHRIANESTGVLELLLVSQPSTKNDRINL